MPMSNVKLSERAGAILAVRLDDPTINVPAAMHAVRTTLAILVALLRR